MHVLLAVFGSNGASWEEEGLGEDAGLHAATTGATAPLNGLCGGGLSSLHVKYADLG